MRNEIETRTIVRIDYPDSHAWADYALVLECEKSWRVTVVGKIDPRSRMGVKRVRRYMRPKDRHKDHREAAWAALHGICGRIIRNYYTGTVLCHDAREVLSRDDARRIGADLSARYGRGWLYSSPEAQRELREIISRAD